MARTHFKDQVDFRARRCAVEARTGADGGDGEQAFNYKAFPAWPCNGMTKQIVECFDAEQGMGQTAIADIGLG